MIDRLRALSRSLSAPVLRTRARPEVGESAEGLEGGGERVDIGLSASVPSYESLNMYEKSHWRRYEFALDCIVENGVTGDFACGTGYGSVLLSRRSARVLGADVNPLVVQTITERYRHVPSVTFLEQNLLAIDYRETFDSIVCFETLEHFAPHEVPELLARFARGLKPGGTLILSTPYMQPPSPEALQMGFHRTFLIDESRLTSWLTDTGFTTPPLLRYQNYQTHDIVAHDAHADFLIAVTTLRDA